jgi:hypothetical protein
VASPPEALMVQTPCPRWSKIREVLTARSWSLLSSVEPPMRGGPGGDPADRVAGRGAPDVVALKPAYQPRASGARAVLEAMCLSGGKSLQPPVSGQYSQRERFRFNRFGLSEAWRTPANAEVGVVGTAPTSGEVPHRADPSPSGRVQERYGGDSRVTIR